ncbi:aminotransferase class I/II-fold pyridoxal phosphate-dependent enzyme [Cryptosporangium sp. NPDC051539]|uniref:aminotransferase class I/II-fold pyridoxal phosphate-dependent enzyme n=1 Tax=Cryptosporangium sp. NPDC051539 TaxID=3363962 RepID=UPI0037A63947
MNPCSTALSPIAHVLLGPGDRAPVPRSVAGWSPRVVTVSSLSKAHGAPGLRVGWLTTTDADLYTRLREAKFLSTDVGGRRAERLDQTSSRAFSTTSVNAGWM